jgi:type VI secretion system secreted protein VgrG
MTSSLRNLAVRVDSGDALDIRRFTVHERMSALFEISLVALSENADIDFDAVVGRPASFRMHAGEPAVAPIRSWTGVCNQIRQVAAEEAGLSTYHVTIVPALWLLTQRRNYRMFQHISELDIARKLLNEWGIEPDLRITGTYKKRKYRVQYAESDFAFMSRMLEDAGISFYFEQSDGETELVLSDAPHAGEPHPGPIAYKDNPIAVDRAFVTDVQVGQRVRPGRYTMRDHDTRLPSNYKLLASAEVPGVEGRLERYHYTPGAFQFGAEQGDATPNADDKGKVRTDEKEGGSLAKKRLEAKRANAKVCSFATNVADLAPGTVFSIGDHPRSDLAAGKPLLVVEATRTGTSDGEWTHRCEARRADIPYRPPLVTRKPKIAGVESATVVGPAGQEIHTDEFGRVRVHFHWDRESGMDDNSSCWIHVSQPWGGAGYGSSSLPRIGQEVLVDFLGGDPDKPVITGRVYTNLQKTPYKLPENKTQSGWKSSSSPQTGGYNEIMFEDAAGRELVRMQAEKDLKKLVKNDEDVIIGHDRTKLVKNDDKLTVDNDRTKVVKRDEDVTVGHDRTERVENDEDITIGRDRSKLVKNDDELTVGNSRTKRVQMNELEVVGVSRTRMVGVNESVAVGVNQSVTVGALQSVEVGANQSVTVGGAQNVKVALASAETVGATKALTVAGAYQISVGVAMNTSVTGLQTEQIGLTKTVTVGEKIELVCGKAKVVLEKEGTITWTVDGGATITLNGKDITLVAGTGGTIIIQGGPDVHVNP